MYCSTDAGRPAYDQAALLRRSAILQELLATMEKLGWGPTQVHSEDTGLFKVQMGMSPGLVNADRLTFAVTMLVPAIADKHEVKVRFVGVDTTMRFTLAESQRGSSVFQGRADVQGSVLGGFEVEEELPKMAQQFIGGFLSHAPELRCVLSTHTHPRGPSVATWGADRSHLIGHRTGPNLELRFVDMATNHYLVATVVLAAGLEGMRVKNNPEPRASTPADENPSEEAPKLPTNLFVALHLLEEKSAALQEIVGGNVTILEALAKVVRARAEVKQAEMGHLVDP